MLDCHVVRLGGCKAEMFSGCQAVSPQVVRLYRLPGRKDDTLTGCQLARLSGCQAVKL